jgi:hypothetical protein
MDFGEAGQENTFVVVTATPGKPAKIEHVQYEGGLPLVDLRATLQELEGIAHAHRTGCWLRVTVPLKEKNPDINRQVRDLLPNALVVRTELPEIEQPRTIRPAEGASPSEYYSAYHMHEYEAEPAPDVVETFQQLHTAVSELEG